MYVSKIYSYFVHKIINFIHTMQDVYKTYTKFLQIDE